MTPAADAQGNRRESALWREKTSHLADYWAVVWNRKWWALTAFLLVAGYIVLDALRTRPVYESWATIRLEDQRTGDEALLAQLGYDDGWANVTAELVVMKSLPVAEIALGKAPLRVVVAEPNGFRPYETALASLGLRRNPMHVEVLQHVPGEAPGSATYYLETDETGRAFAVRPAPGAEAVQTVPIDAQGRASLRLGDHEIVLGFPLKGRDRRVARLDLTSAESAARRVKDGVLARESPPGTGIVRLGYAADDPYEAQRVADALAKAYLEQTQSRKRAELDGRLKWLGSQKREVRGELDEAERKLDAYVRDQGAVLLSERARSIFEEQGRLSAQRLEQEQILQELDTRRAELQSTDDPERILLLLGSEGVDARTSALAAELVQMEIERGALLRLERTPDSPEVRRLDASIAETRPLLEERTKARRDRVVAGLLERIGAIRDRLRRIEEERQAQEKRLEGLPAEERRIAQLTRDVEASSKAYEMLAQWEKEAQIARESALSTATFVEGAFLPNTRTKPNPWRQGVIALLLGSLAGIGLAFFLKYLDRKLRTPEQLEHQVGLQLYATIPDFRSVRRRDRRGLKTAYGGAMPTVTAPDSILAEAYRTLRANIRFAAIGAPIQMLTITSSVDQEGKTLTTLNLAAVMAQAGSRVLVVDADLRRPNANNILERAQAPGLVDVLVHEADWRATIQDTGIANLHLLSAGRPPENPAALLDSERFRELMQEWRGAYEYVLFDVPPVLAVADAAAFFQQLDAVLLLARYGRCPVEAIEGAREQIERLGGNLIGAVLNGFDARKASRGRYGHYGYQGYYGYYARHGGKGPKALPASKPSPTTRSTKG